MPLGCMSIQHVGQCHCSEDGKLGPPHVDHQAGDFVSGTQIYMSTLHREVSSLGRTVSVSAGHHTGKREPGGLMQVRATRLPMSLGRACADE
jgi:hypothetical protein